MKSMSDAPAGSSTVAGADGDIVTFTIVAVAVPTIAVYSMVR